MPDGSTGITVGIDLSQVAIPDKQYAADVAGVVFGEHQVKLLFGQNKLRSSELRSLVILSMSVHAVHRFIETCQEFIAANNRFMEDQGIDPVPPTEINEEPSQTVAMVANMASIARSGRESTVDFYYASPQALHSLRTHSGESLAIASIVRVDLPIAVLSSLISSLDSWCANNPEEVQ